MADQHIKPMRPLGATPPFRSFCVCGGVPCVREGGCDEKKTRAQREEGGCPPPKQTKTTHRAAPGGCDSRVRVNTGRGGGERTHTLTRESEGFVCLALRSRVSHTRFRPPCPPTFSPPTHTPHHHVPQTRPPVPVWPAGRVRRGVRPGERWREGGKERPGSAPRESRTCCPRPARAASLHPCLGPPASTRVPGQRFGGGEAGERAPCPRARPAKQRQRARAFADQGARERNRTRACPPAPPSPRNCHPARRGVGSITRWGRE